MNISAPFIRRPVMTTLVILAVAFFGFLAYRALPVSDLPEVEFPTIEVTINYPGADPITISNNVVTPLEQQFTTIEGIQTISSTSYTGSATIVLQFILSHSIDAAATDVLAAINAANQQLPQDLPFMPTYTKTNPTSTPILALAITSDTMLPADLYTYAHTVIGERINIIEGVSQIQIYGEPYAVRIQVDPQKLASRGIGIDEFATSIQNQNVYLPTGTLYGSKTEFTIDCAGQINRAEGYQNLIIKNDNGLITRVGDVGQALDSLWKDKYYTQFLQKDSQQWMVGLAVQKQPGANTLDTIAKIKDKLSQIEKELPGSVRVTPMYDQSIYIKESVDEVEWTLLIALALVVFVIFIYLGKFVNTIIPALAIPISICGTFVIMQFLGYSIDILSLLSITLAIGFLVDDAIVVLENIVRQVEHGDSPYQGALNGSKQISFTILSMTICLCCIFIPLVFMEGIIGRLLHEFAMTIVIAVLFSGIISLTFTPMLCSRFISSYQLDRKLNFVERISKWFNTALLNLYKPALKWSLNHRKTILSCAILSLAGSLYLLVTLPKDFIPNDDIGFIQGFAKGRDGTSPFETIDVAKQIQSVAIKNPYVNEMMTISATQQDNQTMFFFRLIDIHKRPPIQDVIDMLHKEITSQVVGPQLFLKILPLINLQVGALAAKANYQYTLQSLTSEDLYTSATKLEEKMQGLTSLSTVTSDMDITQPQLHIEIERDKASLYGITASQIENVLSFAFANINLSPINEPDNQYYVIMETLPKFYRDPKMLSQLWLRSSTSGNLVPFSEIVTMTEKVGPLTVNHLNGLPSATISFDLAENVPLSTALTDIDNISKDLPPTVFGRVEGAANIFKKSFANLNYLLLITFFVIYIVLGILYENFYHPITVMSTLPPAALGGLITLVLLQYTLSLYAFVGLVLLLGIVMKNGIIMIDFANEAVEKDNKEPLDAIYTACCVRFRPILMTTFAATMGAVPIAVGLGGMTAQSRRPLGAVIVGGLLFSQVLTLFLTPVVYLYIEKLRSWLNRKKTTEKI
ncbi:MAG: Multidrug resistance protein MdtB [Chlamydiae bacterium]|nr:Multidrug resistance protein MdtB [Chlamydiota bacterium]